MKIIVKKIVIFLFLEISEIGYQEVYNAKPNPKKFYANPLAHTVSYEPHIAPIYSVDFSPFFKNYFLSGNYFN